MSSIAASIGYNLAHLARFSGRDTRGRFWPYAIFLFILSMVAGMIILIPPLVDMMVRIQRYVIEQPAGTEPFGPGTQSLPPELMPDFSATAVPLALTNLLFAMLLAAAIVRRLHDRDKSGWWALLPVPFMIIGQFVSPDPSALMTGHPPAEPGMMLLISMNSLGYWIAVIALIVMLVLEGTKGPNRFGPDPSAAP